MGDEIQPKESAIEKAAYAKITWHLIPFLFICYIVAYLDRVNIGFAKLQMLSDLQFSETAYGFGAGVFFLGYILFEIPSNIILYKVGARIWIARIMICWGVVSGLTMFVTSEWSFYAMRFLLGVAEAGFFPGIILYLTYWFPSERRGKITTLFMIAVPVSGVIGGPLSGWILQNMAGIRGYAGWQWLLLIEALPAVLMGILVLTYLKDGIETASWLSDAEKTILRRRIQADNEDKEDYTFRQLLFDSRIWRCALIYFCYVMGLYGVGFWLPTIIKAMGVAGMFSIGLLSAIPSIVAIIGMVLVSSSSDRHRERRWHVAMPAIFGAAGLICSVVFSGNTWLAMAALSLASFGIVTTFPLFWSLPTAYLRGAAAAAGIALINSCGNLSGFISPYMIGLIKDATNSTDAGMYVLAGFLAVGAVLTLSFPSQLVNR
ncbi:MAG: MFS transporter [Desulforhopalus sp.]|nr:MFS transporter [Desulforhopalus sp.]